MSFLFMNGYYSITYLQCIIYITSHFLYPFIHQWTLRLYPFLAIMNNVARNVKVQTSQAIISFPLDMYLDMELLDHNSIYKFLRNLHTVFHGGWINLHSHQQCTRFLFLYVLTDTCYLFNDSHSNRCEVIAHRGLVCISLMINDAEHFYVPDGYFLNDNLTQ